MLLVAVHPDTVRVSTDILTLRLSTDERLLWFPYSRIGCSSGVGSGTSFALYDTRDLYCLNTSPCFFFCCLCDYCLHDRRDGGLRGCVLGSLYQYLVEVC